MLTDSDFIKMSLNINLFFLRIMKEHSFFLAVSFPPKNVNLSAQALTFKQTFENLLIEAVNLASGKVNIKNDAVTNYTFEAERATEYLTGIPLNTNITLTEMRLLDENMPDQPSQSLVQSIYMLNFQAIQAAQALVAFKTMILDNVLNCKLYTTNYPLLIDHIRREAIFFIDLLNQLQNRLDYNIIQDAIRQENFWNQIMGEHAEFIRGYLDPTEDTLFAKANDFAKEFEELTTQAIKTTQQITLLPEVTKESLVLTKKIKTFKEQGTEGILNCKIRSIIVPLLADHVLREANHYLSLLISYQGIVPAMRN